jgi:acetyl esterase/lipase
MDTAQPFATDPRIDPQIRRFVGEVNASYERLTGGRQLPPAEMRVVAEQVRAPWRQGGPTMWRTDEREVATDHGLVRIRILDPGPECRKPALIYMHGGGWVLFSLDTHDRVMREYAARANVTVVGVDYALSPEVRFPVALDQVVAVARWLHRHGAEFGIDVDRIAMGGDSAGGNLSIGAALTLRDAGEPRLLKGLLLIYAAFDSQVSADALRRNGGPGSVLTGAEVDYFWNEYSGGRDLRDDQRACAIRAPLAGLPPMCLTIPGCDVLTEQNLHMAERLRAAGVSVEATVYDGATHSFIEAMSISSLADRALNDGSRWLRQTLA